MKKLDKNVKYVLILSASILTITAFHKEYEYHPEYEILSDDDAYAKYSNGNVYIGNEEYLANLQVNDNDILVLDERMTNNNIKIYDSYKIDDANMRNEIICIIDEYERQNPTDWDRSVESMRCEWAVHNFFYDLNFKKSSTTDVDFENDEENRYKSKVLTRYFY